MKMKHLIYSYLQHKHVRMEDEFDLLRRNTHYRKMDELDYMEFIIVLTRIKMFCELKDDLHKILQMQAD